jgi:hypothetical protein
MPLDVPSRDAYLIISELLFQYAAVVIERGAQPGDRVSTFFSAAEIEMIEMDTLQSIFGKPRLDSLIGMYVSAVLARSQTVR